MSLYAVGFNESGLVESGWRQVEWREGESSWPSGLLRLYRSTSGLKSLVGPISWDGTPTIDANGVAAGHGPSFGTLTRGAGKVFCHKIKMTKADDGITADEHVLGPLYLRNGYLVAKVGGAEATHAHSWDVGDVVYAKVVATPSGLTMEDF